KSSKVADLAPLPPDPPIAAPGEKVTTFLIIFEAVLKEAKKPEGQA
ncbi:MAG: hypothetical protein H7Y88_07650, partial [Phycisphaerales bacterium]|nr:hypothetical protein [Phycisphaerales bacterium]